MKLLADENIDQPIVEKLRSKGFNISAIEEEAKGADDPEVLQKALDEERVLITFDSDFSDPEGEHYGIIRLTSVDRYQVIVNLVESLTDMLTEKEFRNTVIESSPSEFR